jgi:AsmA protein
MRRVAKWAGIFFAVATLGVISLPLLINVDQFRPALQVDLSAVLGREVTLGNLQLKILSGGVTADDLSVAEDPAFGKPAFLRAKSLHIGVKLWPFLVSRQLVVTDLDIHQPEIALVQSPSGDWNFSTLGGKSKTAPTASGPRAPLNLILELVKVSSGRITLRRTLGHWKPLILEQVSLELRDFSSSSTFPFTLTAQVHGGGALKVDGKAGPINPADSAMTPFTASIRMTGLDLVGSGSNDFVPDIAGLVSFNASGESDGLKIQMTGKLTAEKLKVAKNGTAATRPVEVDFSVQHNLRAHSGNVSQGDIHLGKAVAHLTGSYAEKGEAMMVNMKLSGPDMPLQELEAMLPVVGVVLPSGTSLAGGSASAVFAMEGPADRLVTTGSLAVSNTKLVGFDLPRRMTSIEKLAGIKAGPDMEIQTLSANVRSAPEGTSAQKMTLIVPAIGELSGAGTVSPSNELDFKMSARVHASGLLVVVGNQPIPFTVGGTCSEPVFRPDLKAVAREEVKSIGTGVGKAGGLIKGVFGGKKN